MKKLKILGTRYEILDMNIVRTIVRTNYFSATLRRIIFAFLFLTTYYLLLATPIKAVDAKVDARSVFGTIEPPPEIQPLIDKGGQGAGGINIFLSNLLTLVYEIAAIVVVFMFVFGAFEWIMSGGEKEKVASAQKRITNALIGFVIMAITFGILNVFGEFTGFTNLFNF